MPKYDAAHYSPPDPVAIVTLSNPATGVRIPNVQLLIDSGADVTLLPRHSVQQLGLALQAGDQVEVEGYDGSRSFVQALDTDVIFSNRTYRGRYLICDSEHGVLGRDVINHMRLILDGPNGEWS